MVKHFLRPQHQVLLIIFWCCQLIVPAVHQVSGVRWRCQVQAQKVSVYPESLITRISHLALRHQSLSGAIQCTVCQAPKLLLIFPTGSRVGQVSVSPGGRSHKAWSSSLTIWCQIDDKANACLPDSCCALLLFPRDPGWKAGVSFQPNQSVWEIAGAQDLVSILFQYNDVATGVLVNLETSVFPTVRNSVEGKRWGNWSPDHLTVPRACRIYFSLSSFGIPPNASMSTSSTS